MYIVLQRTLSNCDALIFGDFNLPHIDWLRGSEGESHRMLEFVENSCLSHKVNEPLRDDNILDLVLATQEKIVANVSVSEHLGSCDHRLVRLDIKAETMIAENDVLVPNFKTAGFERLRNSLTNIQLVSNDNVDEYSQGFKILLLTEQK